jgi:hypothetical protein
MSTDKIILTKNIISVQKGFVCPPSDENHLADCAVATVQTHLMQWGYMLTEKAFNELSKSNISFIENFHDEVIGYLKIVLGGKYKYEPLYKNFPEEVMSFTDFELFLKITIFE